MRLQLLDLDGIGLAQPQLTRRCAPFVHDLRAWGPRLRLSCRSASFRQFESALAQSLGETASESPAITFFGSGDFHHVSLAIVRRLQTPCNLLVLDKHPDWMRGIPVLHCGTWLYHAARLPQVQRIFHVGGELDFDNPYRVLAPWPELVGQKIKVIPAVRRFTKGKWSTIAHDALRPQPNAMATLQRVRTLIENDRADLARWPLYVSFDKDVLTATDAIVNWDSGLLTSPEAEAVLRAFYEAAGGKLIGMDVVGDWSPVFVRGLYRKMLHWTEHPSLKIDSLEAATKNEAFNLRLVEFLASLGEPALQPSVSQRDCLSESTA
jgi:arginase family enzyme